MSTTTELTQRSMEWKQTSDRAFAAMKEIPRDERGNPLTLEGAIRSVILKNPDFTRYRDHALGVLYTLLGSGIRWIDNRLGDASPNNYMNLPPAADGQGCWSRAHGRDESLETMLDKYPDILDELKREFEEKDRQRQRTIMETIDNIDRRCQEYEPAPQKWYPISWYGCNLCAPNEAQQDFREGAIETCMLILDTSPPMGTQVWRVHLRTRSYAEEILSALNRRPLVDA